MPKDYYVFIVKDTSFGTKFKLSQTCTSKATGNEECIKSRAIHVQVKPQAMKSASNLEPFLMSKYHNKTFDWWVGVGRGGEGIQY